MKTFKKPRSFKEVLFMKKAVSRVEFYNPLNITAGAIVNINYIGHEDIDYQVERVCEYNRAIGGDNYVTAVYDLIANVSAKGKKQRVRLYANQIADATRDDAYSYNLLLLKEDFSDKWSQGLQEALDDSCRNKVWAVDDDGLEDGVQVRNPYHDEYQRVNDVSSPYNVTIYEAKDKNGDGEFTEDEVKRRSLKYYDFCRSCEDVPGAVSREFYIVEVESESHYVVMWKGDEIDPSRVKAL